MIKLFRDKKTEALFWDKFVSDFQGMARPAKRKLDSLHAASRLGDLMIPPANRLEKLKGDRNAYYSIRVNDQWRIVFRWMDGNAYDVAIEDYH